MTHQFFNLETRAGEPVTVGDKKLIPFSQALRLHVPWINGGLIWNRPASVTVLSADGQEQSLPVHDVTRQIQISLLGGGILGSLFLWWIFRTFRRMKEETQ